MNTTQSRVAVTCSVLLSLLGATASKATIVEFQTPLGNFEVNLYDNGTPATVANFLNYVNNGAYTQAVIHRSVPGFVVQGGGFAYDPVNQLINIDANPAVTNEPAFSNVRATIAMAKIGGDPNSATNQWFFNLTDNAGILDAQNGGFTVFGEVVGAGMNVVDAIAELPRYAFDAPFGELPLRNYTPTDFDNGVVPDDSHFVIISAVVVTDSTVDSAADLDPTPNTLINQNDPPPAEDSGDSGGGGAGGIGLFLLLLPLLVNRRKASSAVA